MGKNLFRKTLAALCAAGLLLAAAGCADDDGGGNETTKYTVTFDSKGGNEVAQQSVESGKTASKPANDPTKSGVTFGGWYKGEEPFSFSTAITGSITLTAKWISEQYTKGSTVLTFYDDKTFEYKDANGTSRGTYAKSDDGKKIEATFTGGSKQGGTLEVDTSDGAPSVKEDGTDVGGFEQVEEPTNQNTQDGGTYQVGSIVTISGSDTKYLVIADTATGRRAAENTANHYYPNPRADLYRDYLLDKYGASGTYTILFNTETKKENPMTTSYWDDEYLVMRGKEKHYRIRYRWERGSGKIDEEPFNNSLTADALRKDYDPTCIIITNYKPVYGNDLSNKHEDLFYFYYTGRGNRVAFSDDVLAQRCIRKDYVSVAISGQQKEVYQYEFYDRIAEKAHSYKLRNPIGSSFFEFKINYDDDFATPRSYKLAVTGAGTISGSTDSSLYSKSVTVSSTMGNETSEYVSKSDSTTSIGDKAYPAEITVSVPFAFATAELAEYAKVTFTPKEQTDGRVIYLPRKSENVPFEFIEKFQNDYYTLFEGKGGTDDLGNGDLQIPSYLIVIGKVVTGHKDGVPTNLILPDGVTAIADNAFKYCDSLVNVTIPNSVTEIRSKAFSDCRNLVNVTIPASVTKIDASAFEYCTSMKNVYYGGTTTYFQQQRISLPSYISVRCSDTPEGLPEWVTVQGKTITDYNRDNYNGDKEVELVIPEGITTISDYALRDCHWLTSIEIPGTVTSIGKDAFSNCYLQKVYYATTLAQWCQMELGGLSLAQIIILKDGNDLKKLTKIDIPDSVTKIGRYAFYNFYNLTSVTIPESVTEIGDYAFAYCNLTDIAIPNKVTTIGTQSFSGCNLTDITIPASVTNIGHNAFNVHYATSVTFDDTTTEWYAIWYKNWENVNDGYEVFSIGTMSDNPKENVEKLRSYNEYFLYSEKHKAQ